MSNLSQIVAYRRSQGGGVAGSLAGGIKDRLKEKFDPRQLLNQKGLLVSLFPGLKPFKSKTSGTNRTAGKSIEQSSLDVSEVKPLFEQIQYNTTLTAKNLTVLPSIHRDFNVIRQNIVKLLKLEKIDARTKADMYFKTAARREELYESQLEKLREKSKSPTRLDNSSSEGSFKNILMTIGAVALIAFAFKGVSDAIDKLKDVDLKKSFFDFSDNLTSSISGLMDSLMLKLKNLTPDDFKPNLNIIPEAAAAEVPQGDGQSTDIQKIFDQIKLGETGRDYNRAFGDFKTKSGTYENRLHMTKKFNINGQPQPVQKTPEEWSEMAVEKGGLGKRKKLTEMTLTEVKKFIKSRESVRPGQSAIGAYQYMGSTLDSAIKGLNLPMDTTLFDQATQDKLAMRTLTQKGKYLQSKNLPVTGTTLAISWGLGEGGVGPVLKAIKEGKGGMKLGDVMNQAGYSDRALNRANNPWMEQTTEQYYGDKLRKYGNQPVLLDNKKPNDKVSMLLNDMKTGQLVEAGTLDINTSSVEASIPVVMINNNTFQENIIMSENESVEKDYLPFLFRNAIT